MPHPWPPTASTGVGPMPGDDRLAAARLAFELPGLPFAPWLPDAGPGADFAGRGAALLVDLHVDLQPSGWRLVPRPGRDERRARDSLARELDALEEAGHGWEGPLKVSVPGPWSLAASIDLARGERALADAGATRDVAASLADGVRALVASVRSRLPGVTDVIVQVDEPLLPHVLAGAIKTASGWSAYPSVEGTVAEAHLGLVVAAAGDAAGVRCSSPRAPVPLLVRAGARWLGVDAGALDGLDEDHLGEALEGAGVGLLLGLVPPAAPPDVRACAEPARRLWARLGLPPDALTRTVVVTPADGVELLAPGAVPAVFRRCREVAAALAE